MAKKKEAKTDDFSTPTSDNDSDIVRIYRAKCEAALAQIKDIAQFRAEDKMVDYVFLVGRKLFDVPLDKQNLDEMIRTGGKLTGAYVYLGQKSARARAERDVYTQKLDEVEKERLLALMHSGVKVTEARAAVAGEVVQLADFVLEKDVVKNQWENITDANEKMVSFIQSAIRVKEGERYQSARLQNNQGSI